MDGYTVNATIQGYHIYKIWNAAIGQVLTCKRERGNVHDPYAVAVVRFHSWRLASCHIIGVLLVYWKKRHNHL